MKREELKIAIVGGGNVGRFLSTMLVSLGYNVELVCRAKHRSVQIDNSLLFEIKGDFGDKSYLIPTVSSIKDLSGKKDVIIFATKSFDMLDRVKHCLNKLTPTGTIVTIQNIFSIDKLFAIIPPECSVCMICDFACKTVNRITYVKDSDGVVLGVYHPKAIGRLNRIKHIFKEFMKVETSKDIVGFTMGRNIINGAISLLGGISGLNLGDILRTRRGKYLFYKIIEEAYNVCKHYNINVLPYNNELDYKKFINNSLSSKIYRHKIFKVLMKQNGHVKSSALDNLEHGEKTEIRCLVGSLIHYANDTNTNIPTIRVFDELLDCLEHKKLAINKRNIDIIYNNLKTHTSICCNCEHVENIVEEIIDDCKDD